MSVVIEAHRDENILYPSMDQPENDALNDSRDVSKDDTEEMEEQMSSTQDHVEDGPQKPQHIFVLNRESSLGKREHDSVSFERRASESSGSRASHSPTASPHRGSKRSFGKKKQKLSARQRKRQLERNFGSDYQPGTIRHRLNFLQHSFGDQLALIEESLPQTFHRNMNLETFIRNKAEQHEQHNNDKSLKRSPSFRRSPERVRKPSAVKESNRAMSDIQEGPDGSEDAGGEMAEIMTFAPLETPHFESSSSNLSQSTERSSASLAFSHAGTFPLDRSAREWRLSKFLEESPPPSPTRKVVEEEDVTASPTNETALPEIPVLEESDTAAPTAVLEEKDDAAAATVSEPTDVPAAVEEQEATPAPIEKQATAAVVSESSDDAADAAVVADQETAPAPSDVRASAFSISATGIVENLVSTPEKAPKEENEAVVEEPVESSAIEEPETTPAPLTEELATEEMPGAASTEEAPEEVVIPKVIEESSAVTEEPATPKEEAPAIEQTLTTQETPKVDEEIATPVVTEEAPEAAQESATPAVTDTPAEEPPTTEEMQKTTDESVAPAMTEEAPKVADVASTTEEPATPAVTEEVAPKVVEEPASPDVAVEAATTEEAPKVIEEAAEAGTQVVTEEVPTTEEPATPAVVEEPEEESEHSVEVVGDDVAADGEHDPLEASSQSLSQPEGVVESPEGPIPSEGVMEAPAETVQEGVTSEPEGSQEEAPVSAQIKESASQIPEIGADTPSRGESPQIQIKKTVRVEPESKPEAASIGVVSEAGGVVSEPIETAPKDSPAPAAPVVSGGVAEEESKEAPAMAIETNAAPTDDAAVPSTPVGDQSVSSSSKAPRTPDAVELARLEQATPIKPAESSAATTPPTPDAVELARLEQQTPVKRKLEGDAVPNDAAAKQPKAEGSDGATTDENTDPQNCPSPSSVMDTELDENQTKPVKKEVPLKENRKIRFADEAGQDLTKEYIIEREANYASRIVVMLLSPRDRKFEFLHAEYPLDASTTVQVLLEQVPLLATNDAFRTKKFNALLQTENSRELDNNLALQDYCFKESEIVLGIPDDFTVANMTKMAVPLLLNKKLMKTVKQAIRKGRGLKTVQSGEEWRK